MQETQEIWDQSLVRKIPWRRKWQPTPVFLPGKFHGLRSRVGYSPWGPKELDTNYLYSVQFSCSVVSDSDFMDCSTPGFPVHHQLLELAQTHVHWVSDAIQPSHPLTSPSPPSSIFPSISIFSSESLRIRWPKYWSFSFSIRPSNEYSGLISFRFDWFDLLVVWGTLKSLFQHHSSNSLTLSFLYLSSINRIYNKKAFGKLCFCQIRP